MWKNSNNYTVNINIGRPSIRVILTNSETQLADFSLPTLKNDFRAFIAILKALMSSVDSVAQEKGIKVSKLYISIAVKYKMIKGKIVDCSEIPALNNINLSDYLGANKYNIEYNYNNEQASDNLRVKSMRAIRRLNLKSI
ncbi:hypothetical protein ISS03_02660 [Patescibacteria group bacterium]|nr:hypothetical protein [Patescibacteria group bacterium]